MKFIKNNKGITLISLVITIIVLLILAMVSVNTLFGNDTAIKKADEAKIKNEKSEIYDVLAMAVNNIVLDEGLNEDSWNNYYGTKELFCEKGKISSGEYNITEYSYENEKVTLKIKKPNGTGTTFEYEIDVNNYNIVPKGQSEGTTGGGTDESPVVNNEYSIAYEKLGGDFEDGVTAKTSYKHGEVYIFPTPIKSGYGFEGWYTSSSYTEGTELSSTNQNTNENLTLYAKWIQETDANYFTYSTPDANGNVSISGLSSTGQTAYDNDEPGLLDLVIPKQNSSGNKIIGINNYVFHNKNKLEKVVFNDNITQIGQSAFEGCTGIEGTITIPKQIETIEMDSFRSCSNVTKLVLHENITSVGVRSFQYCSKIEELIIPINVNASTDANFDGCTGIKKVVFTKGKNGATEGVNCGSNAPWRLSANNEMEVTIDKDITQIGNSMFSGCTKLKFVELPPNLTTIGSYAFYNCQGMEGQMNLPNTLTSIGESAFEKCSGLTGTITIPEQIEIIAMDAFRYCSNVTKLVLHENVTSVGVRAFQYCSKIEELTIPINVNASTDANFVECTGIKKVVFTKGKNGATDGVNCGSNAPWRLSANNEIEVTFDQDITKIGDSMFRGCTKLKLVELPPNLTTIGSYAFYNCQGMEGQMNLPNTLTSIGESAFEKCSGLTGTITIPNQIETINMDTFNGCSQLSTVIINKSVKTIGYRAFLNSNPTFYYTGSQAEWQSVEKQYAITITEYDYGE